MNVECILLRLEQRIVRVSNHAKASNEALEVMPRPGNAPSPAAAYLETVDSVLDINTDEVKV